MIMHYAIQMLLMCCLVLISACQSSGVGTGVSFMDSPNAQVTVAQPATEALAITAVVQGNPDEDDADPFDVGIEEDSVPVDEEIARQLVAGKLELEPDPLEKLNRPVFSFNEWLDKRVLRPVAVGYHKLPAGLRRSVNNFYGWLDEPSNTFNNLMQGNIKGTVVSLSRLVINGTVGVLGFFDPARRMGVPSARTDFDETLERWGLKNGYYIVLPVVGATDVRDLIGFIGDAATSPEFYARNRFSTAGLFVLRGVQTRAKYLSFESAIIGDPYEFIRDAYQSDRSDGWGADEDDDFGLQEGSAAEDGGFDL